MDVDAAGDFVWSAWLSSDRLMHSFKDGEAFGIDRIGCHLACSSLGETGVVRVELELLLITHKSCGFEVVTAANGVVIVDPPARGGLPFRGLFLPFPATDVGNDYPKHFGCLFHLIREVSVTAELQ